MQFTLSDGNTEMELLSFDGNIYVAAEGLGLAITAKELTYAESADSEGRWRIRDRATNPEGSFTVYFKGDTNEDFWEAVDDFQTMVESAHRNNGTLAYTPPNAADTVTYDLVSITVTDLPQRGVHLLQRHGEATVTYEIRPYGRLDEYEAVEETSQDGPIDSMTVEFVPGQVDAWGDLTITDESSQARYFGEIGVQHNFDPDNPEPILLEAVTDLTALAGSSSTRAGSVSTNIIRAGLSTSPVAICTSGDQPHSGTWKFRVRVWPSATTVRVRLAYRTGDGPFTTGGWITVPNEDDWYDLDLGTFNVPELPSGHTAEFRIEGISTSGIPSVDVDTLTPLPADSYLKLVGANSPETSTATFVAADDFGSHSAGNLTGKTPPLAPSGNWSGAGDSDDFVLFGPTVVRGASSDSDANTGRYERCGTGVLAGIVGQVDVNRQTAPTNSGIMVRYVDTNNWLMARYTDGFNIELVKRVSGTVTTLGLVELVELGSWRTLKVVVDTAGDCIVYEGPQNGTLSPIIQITGDASLATGGAIDDGGYGIYSSNIYAAGAVAFDNFTVASVASISSTVQPAMNEDQSVRVLHDTALTESDPNWGVTPQRYGRYLTLPPSTRAGLSHRIVQRWRRQDIDSGFPDTGLTDEVTASLTVTPRVLVVGA